MPLDFSIFNEAACIFHKGDAITFTSMSGSSKGLLISIFQGPFLLLCDSESSALELYHDTAFWSEFPDREKPVLIPQKDNPERLKNIRSLHNISNARIITSVEAALSPTFPADKYPLLKIIKNSSVDRDFVINSLKNSGYHTVSLVSGHGEMSIRGGILDVFPSEEELPLRIEFFGDEIESVRIFDTDTQRTIKELNEVSVGPASEPEEGPNLFDVFKETTLIVNEPDDIKRHHPDLLHEMGYTQNFSLVSLPIKGEGFDLDIKGTGGLGILREERKSIEDFVKKVEELQKQFFILMICSSEGQAKRLKDLFLEEDMIVPILKADSAVRYKGSSAITTGRVSRGFIFQNCIVLTERDIFGEKPAFRSIKKSHVSRLVSSIEDFKEGDYLVHVEHGIGRFLGLQNQVIEGFTGDFIAIEYLGGDRIYVPLERINIIQKYHATENIRPKIDRLGGKTWLKTREKVQQKIKDMAKKLLALYARRTTSQGHAFSPDTELHKEFDGFFLYEETPDQLTSINEIKHDMEKQDPMDRLLCGDVGYGKTEVIMRACFKAVFDSKQAAILVPTTILAEQHFDTFTSRFSAFPIKIDFISRFKSRAEQKQTLKTLEEGNIDIIIGTHRLFAKDINYYDLGLLVIDEEHKFGVKHKEKIKALNTNVDILSLSATPIPRTLHMALSGIRAMSAIETPPEDRLAVKSIVARFNPEAIKDALRKELGRGGQVFFVHNRIQDIYKIANFLAELVPEGRISVAHGQMREKELENVMRLFFKRETDILVSTAIIGSGLDIPSANTIIINRADKFGLADLYQLRGRVGRSNIGAYAYFLIPGEDIITVEAKKRLLAIQELSYLGAGFRLAVRDLEIRGAGNLLGSEQSGHIEAVGFDLYVEMLEQSVSELKGEKTLPRIEPVLDLKVTAIIPESYIEDPDLRLSLYRKISLAKDINSLKEFLEELKDRFGQPPQETLRLIEIMELKVLAKKLAVTRINNINGMINILFSPETGVTSDKVLSLFKKRKDHIKFLPAGGFKIDLSGRPWDETFRELKEIMGKLYKNQK